MVISTKDFKEVCSTILNAIDSNELSAYTETLALKTDNKILYLNVTNGEYYASVKFPLTCDDKLEASVNAKLFLKLIAAVTSDDIELNVKDTYVQVKANGTYKIPLIFEDDKLLTLPEIKIDNITTQMKISGDILNSILNYNSKELLRGAISKPVQKMYYVDENGCITFTGSGACVNNFTLEKPIKVLFNNRLVKLFKLFKDSMVDFSLGYDAISQEIVQTKVKFETPNITITAVTGCNDELLAGVPVTPIRGKTNANFSYTLTLNTEELRQAINRLLLFSAGYGTNKNLKPYSLFELRKDTLSIYDTLKENVEVIKLTSDNLPDDTNYDITLDLADFKIILDTVTEEYITLALGDPTLAKTKSVILKRQAIFNIVANIPD